MQDYAVRYGEFRGIDEENRTADFVISTGAKDRHGTVVNQANWHLDNYHKNGIVGYQHDVYGGDMCNKADPDDVIGRGEVFFDSAARENGDSQKLIGRVHFEDGETNPKADKVFKKVKAGTLRATSVGFIPIANEQGEIGTYGYVNERNERVDQDTFYFNGQELLEFSIVNIPSNPEATAKTLRARTHNALLFVKEQLGQDYSFADIDELQVKDIREFLEKGIKPYRNNSQEREIMPAERTPKAPKEREWNADAAVQRLRKWASSDGSGDKATINFEEYKRAFAYRDGNEPLEFTSYKLPHHDVINGELHVVWNGVVAAAAALEGARGGVDIPSDENDDAKRHIGVHYEQFGEVAPWDEEDNDGDEEQLSKGRKRILEIRQRELENFNKQNV